MGLSKRRTSVSIRGGAREGGDETLKPNLMHSRSTNSFLFTAKKASAQNSTHRHFHTLALTIMETLNITLTANLTEPDFELEPFDSSHSFDRAPSFPPLSSRGRRS